MTTDPTELALLESVPNTLLIGGQWQAATGNRTVDVRDPATDERILVLLEEFLHLDRITIKKNPGNIRKGPANQRQVQNVPGIKFYEVMLLFAQPSLAHCAHHQAQPVDSLFVSSCWRLELRAQG